MAKQRQLGEQVGWPDSVILSPHLVDFVQYLVTKSGHSGSNSWWSFKSWRWRKFANGWLIPRTRFRGKREKKAFKGSSTLKGKEEARPDLYTVWTKPFFLWETIRNFFLLFRITTQTGPTLEDARNQLTQYSSLQNEIEKREVIGPKIRLPVDLRSLCLTFSLMIYFFRHTKRWLMDSCLLYILREKTEITIYWKHLGGSLYKKE